jgi:hypothetical protein
VTERLPYREVQPPPEGHLEGDRGAIQPVEQYAKDLEAAGLRARVDLRHTMYGSAARLLPHGLQVLGLSGREFAEVETSRGMFISGSVARDGVVPAVVHGAAGGPVEVDVSGVCQAVGEEFQPPGPRVSHDTLRSRRRGQRTARPRGSRPARRLRCGSPR